MIYFLEWKYMDQWLLVRTIYDGVGEIPYATNIEAAKKLLRKHKQETPQHLQRIITVDEFMANHIKTNLSLENLGREDK